MSSIQDPTQQLNRLYEAEYSDRLDIIIRSGGVLIGGALLYLYTGWAISYIWGVVYAAAHAIHWPFLRARLGKATARDTWIAGLQFLVVSVSFIWVPTYLAAQPDPALMLVGFYVIAATYLYHIKRADTALWLVWAQIIVFAICLIFILVNHLLRMEALVAQVGSTMVTATAITYLCLVMTGVRRARIELARSAERLAQEQKMSAIGRLAGGVAHDFNNILTVVNGNLELFHLAKDRAEEELFIKEAQEAGKRAESIVQQLLIFARKAPKRTLTLELNEKLEEVFPLFQSLIPRRVTLDSILSEQDLIVRLDEAQLVTALLNLIKNAADAVNTGGRVILRCQPTHKDGLVIANGTTLPKGDYALITVEDNGTGIPPEIKHNVIDPFFTTKDPGKGTGLGLPMVLGFAEDLGGGLVIDSSPAGTRVSLYVPLLQTPLRRSVPLSPSIDSLGS